MVGTIWSSPWRARSKSWSVAVAITACMGSSFSSTLGAEPTPRSAPGIGAVRDRVQVAGREALVAERVQQAGVLSEHDVRDFPPHGDHLVAVVRVGDDEDVRPHEIEDREVVGREGPDAAGADVVILRARALEALHAVRERGAPEVGRSE